MGSAFLARAACDLHVSKELAFFWSLETFERFLAIPRHLGRLLGLNHKGRIARARSDRAALSHALVLGPRLSAQNDRLSGVRLA